MDEKIKEQFHYFNIHADVDSVYGNWAVSTDGDVVNFLYPYAILAIHFKDTDKTLMLIIAFISVLCAIWALFVPTLGMALACVINDVLSVYLSSKFGKGIK